MRNEAIIQQLSWHERRRSAQRATTGAAKAPAPILVLAITTITKIIVCTGPILIKLGFKAQLQAVCCHGTHIVLTHHLRETCW